MLSSSSCCGPAGAAAPDPGAGPPAPACSPGTISGLSAGPSVASLTAPAYETAERSWCTDRADLGLVDQLGAGEGLGQPLDTGADVGRIFELGHVDAVLVLVLRPGRRGRT